MADSTRILTAIRNDLVAAGLVRRPASASSAPALFVEPAGGPPAPGDRMDGATDLETAGPLVATIRLSSEAPARAGAAYRRLLVIDFLYRSKTTAGLKAGRDLDTAIRGRLVETAGYGTGIRLDAGGPAETFALEVYVFAGLGPLSDVDGVRTDLAKYALEVLAS